MPSKAPPWLWAASTNQAINKGGHAGNIPSQNSSPSQCTTRGKPTGREDRGGEHINKTTFSLWYKGWLIYSHPPERATTPCTGLPRKVGGGQKQARGRGHPIPSELKAPRGECHSFELCSNSGFTGSTHLKTSKTKTRTPPQTRYQGQVELHLKQNVKHIKEQACFN